MWSPKTPEILLTILLLQCIACSLGAHSNSIPESLKTLRKLKDCFSSTSGVILCFKEKALEALNSSIEDDTPVHIMGIVDIVKDRNFNTSKTDEMLPADPEERSSKVDDLLYTKVEDYLQSRSLKIHLGDVEGRKKGGKKGGGMLMMGGLAMAGMMAQMFMGKIAFIAASALMIAKMALLISAIVGLKKLASGGGGGESTHVVYATPESGGSHGGGGWQRSYAEDEYGPYRAYASSTSASDRYNLSY